MAIICPRFQVGAAVGYSRCSEVWERGAQFLKAPTTYYNSIIIFHKAALTRTMTDSKDALELEQFLNLIQTFLFILIRHWLSAGAVLASAVALTALSTFSQEPLYEAVGKLRFERISDVSSLTGGGAEKVGRLDILAPASDPLLTEAEVIRSRSVTEMAISRLYQEGSITGAKDESPCNSSHPNPMSPTPNLSFTSDKIGMKSTNIGANRMEPEIFLSGLEVRPIPGTDILKISYKSNFPQQALQRANAIMEAYMAYSASTKQGDINKALKAIEERLIQAEESWKKAEWDLKVFKNSEEVVNLKQQAELALNQVQELKTLSEKLGAELGSVNQQFTVLQNQLGMDLPEAMLAISLAQDTAVQSAIAEVQNTQLELARQQARFKENSPLMEELNRRRSALQKLLTERIEEKLGGRDTEFYARLQMGLLHQNLIENLVLLEARRQGLNRQIEDLNQLAKGHESQLDKFPNLEKRQSELERKRDVSQATYSNLLSQLQSLRVSKEQKVINASILECAVEPKVPVAPRTTLNLIIGSGAGLMLSVMTAFIVEGIERVSKNRRSQLP